MAARAMANFGLTRLADRQSARRLAQRARPARGFPAPIIFLDQVELFDTVEQAVADFALLFAHHRARPRSGQAGGCRRQPPASEIAAEISGGGKVGILFGRERYGLAETRRSRSPTGSSPFRSIPASPSLNLAQAVLLIGYEWFKLSTAGRCRFAMSGALRAASAASDAGVLRTI